jgi:hypothetical protein
MKIFSWEGTQKEFMAICEKYKLSFEPFGYGEKDSLNWYLKVEVHPELEEIAYYDEYGNRFDTITKKEYPEIYEKVFQLLQKIGKVENERFI